MKRKLLKFLGVATLLLFTSTMLGQTNTWNGSSSTNWNTAANWSDGTVPLATDDVVIPSAPANQPTISAITAVSAALTVQDGAILTIDSDGGLTVDGALNINTGGSVTINSTASDSGTLIFNGTRSGNITYKRFVTGGGWYLIAAPVEGYSGNDLFNDNGGTATFITGNAHPSFGNNAAVAGYNGTAWSYISSVGFFGPSMSAGTGVSVNLISDKSLEMFGSLASSASVGLNTDAFTLLGNPFTASFNVINFLAANTARLTQETVWVRSGSGYTAYNDVSPIKIAPGQGFFVRANGTGGSASFSRTNNLSHDAADTFGSKSIPFATYELFLDNNGTMRSTRVFYAENRTTGFDNGSDSSLFSDNDDFSIYTELVEGSEGQKLEIQTLPDTNIESFIVPVGVTAVADSEIVFSLEASNFDENIQITLEDRVTNTFTRLDEANSTYKATTENALDGVGRFYMHTTQDALSVDTNEWLSTVQIYKVNNANLRITGLTQGEATVEMYNLLGKQVLSTSFEAMGTKDIAIPNDISKGIYFVKLETSDGILNKKIILE
ncbi:T9SS type A sorting domain-containing protein [Polaribacter litorisediminis]|uniref:T9SS type A sorting domain-containing protein n=1 Tax=Polaribacter litorisediminis TaxID=1908341 RepID=UPI001CBE77B2|nr:T9SS type A sorting domain-containing protein [Polaribacter litorisediminis]UAM99921.1 T9SS type A sorting domain-containing protein [Polaribacter litorisediminis]